ncbi:MAG: ATP-binding protein [Gemmatimonadaceae bacterium]
MIKLKTLGQCVIEIGENRVGPDAELLFALQLYLAMDRGRRIGRGALAALLWPGIQEARAAHSLRQSVYRLKALGASVESNRSHIWVPKECVDGDYFPLLDVAENGRVEELAEETSGTFLPGYAPTFSSPFAEWIDRQRDIVDSAIRRVLVAAVTAKRSRGEWSEVETIAKRILSIDPLNEEATLAAAQAMALHGGKVQALALLDRYLKEIGPDAREIRLPASVLRRRIADAQNIDRAHPVIDPPFTGRAEEMADLLQALQLALGGQGSACVLWGEPGMGKTRLSHEFTRVAQLERVQIVRIGAQSNDERRPLSAFVDVVPKLLNLPGAIGCSPDSMQYLRRLIEHNTKDTLPTPDTREAAFLYASIRRSVFDLIDAVASEKCLIVVFEDVHWLDAASWEVISEAIPWLATRRVLLVMTSRVPDAERKKGITELPSLHRRHLRPLGDKASRKLLDGLLQLRSGTVREDLAEWCAATGGGNPYYLSELALHGLREGGGSSRGYRLPASLTTLISERIALLRPVSLRVLQACAVLGKNSTLERLETVLQQRRVDLLDALEELENHGLIISDGARVQSKHELLSQAALVRLSGLSLRLLHHHAALVLEGDAEPPQSVAALWECAEHWLQAGEVGRALRFLRSCARQAVEIGLPTEAAELLEKAVGLTGTTGEKVEVLGELVYALRAGGQWDQVLVVINDVLQLRFAENVTCDSIHDDNELLALEASYRTNQDPMQIFARLKGCVESSSASTDHRVRAALWAMMLGDNLALAAETRDIYEQIDPYLDMDGLEALGHQVKIIYHTVFGDYNIAEHSARASVVLARQSKNPELVVRSLFHSSVALRMLGFPSDAIIHGTEAYEIAERQHFGTAACSVANAMAWTYLLRDELVRTSEWVDRANRWLPLLQNPSAIYNVLATKAHLAFQRGDYRDAERLQEKARRAMGERMPARSQAHLLALGLQLRLASSGEAPNTAEVQQLLELHYRTRILPDHDPIIVGLHASLGAVGRSEQAGQLVADYVSRYRRERSPFNSGLKRIMQSGPLTTIVPFRQA